MMFRNTFFTLFFSLIFFGFTPLLMAQSGQAFLDVTRTHSDYTAIDFFATEKVIKGYEDGTFKPENFINRVASLKILLEASDIDLNAPYQGDLFPDLTDKDDWFIPYVMKAYAVGIVKGNDLDGTFAPADPVNQAAFTKMLFETNQLALPELTEENRVVDLDIAQWYAPYLNQAVTMGILSLNEIDPAKALTRSEVVKMMYLVRLLKGGDDTQFLLDRSEAEMAQIEIYMADDDLFSAKASARRAYDLTQQAYKNKPDHPTVLGVAKLAAAYDLLVDMVMAALEKKKDEVYEKGNLVIQKATEAWQANQATQPLGAYLKQQARQVAAQMGVTLEE